MTLSVSPEDDQGKQIQAAQGTFSKCIFYVYKQWTTNKSWVTRIILISSLLTFFMSTENIPMSKQNIFMSSLTTYWMSTENEPHVNKTKKENKFLWISSGNHMPARRFRLILKINIFQKYLICSQLPKKTSSTFRHILSCNCHRKAWCRCRRLPLEGESLIQERCHF